jgi:hypothetical protein
VTPPVAGPVDCPLGLEAELVEWAPVLAGADARAAKRSAPPRRPFASARSTLMHCAASSPTVSRL